MSMFSYFGLLYRLARSCKLSRTEKFRRQVFKMTAKVEAQKNAVSRAEAKVSIACVELQGMQTKYKNLISTLPRTPSQFDYELNDLERRLEVKVQEMTNLDEHVREEVLVRNHLKCRLSVALEALATHEKILSESCH